MNLQVMFRAERTLLKVLDTRLQSEWNKTLEDVVTDLRIHWVDIKHDITSDKLIEVNQSSRLLDFVAERPLIKVRNAISRISQGTFGFCAGCGTEIQADILEANLQ